MGNPAKIGLSTAVSLVVANMIGTGVFTSLGFQVVGITDGFSLMMLWLVGGLISLCGAVVYSELGARFPNSGGEYNFLSELYHPALGFLAGWVSVTIGFAAPVAMSSVILAKYTSGVVCIADEKILAISVILIITLLHSSNLETGSMFQRFFTLLKVLVILFFIACGFFFKQGNYFSVVPTTESVNVIFSGSFAVALYWVTYSYSGWNAAAYMTSEINHPKKNLPLALILGTLAVTLFYLGLNYVFLNSAPISEISGKKEVGLIAARYIFGENGGNLMGLVIALLLVSAISAMVMAGPRVTQAMGHQIPSLRFLSYTGKRNVPFIAILLQSFISIILVLTLSFEFVLQFTAFSLNLFTFLSVLGVFFLKTKKGENSQAFGFRFSFLFFPACLFLLVQAWILYYGLKEKTNESLLGFLNLLLGLLFWYSFNAIKKNKNET